LEKNWKNFHFQEVNFLISFLSTENEGRKYLYYSVEFTNRNKDKTRTKVCLSEIVDNSEFENGYPHTVGFFKGSVPEKELESAYLELRIIRSIEDFWKFLNDLDI